MDELCLEKGGNMIKPIKSVNNKRRLLVISAATVAIALTALTVPAAQAADPAATTGPGYSVEPVGDPFEAAYTIESGIHPGAEKIAAQKKILLKEGNGQLMNVDCNYNDATQIVLEGRFTREGQLEEICFKPTNLPGWLTMEIPGSFGIQAGDRPLSVKANDNGTIKTIDVEKEQTGNLANSQGQTTIVVEIKTPGAP